MKVPMIRRFPAIPFCAAALAAWVSSASALPHGRAWSAKERLVAPPVDSIVALDLLPNGGGIPQVLALGRGAAGAPARARWWTLSWSESTWSTSDSIPGAPGEGPAPVVARAGDRFRLWIEPRDKDPFASAMRITRWPGHAVPETVAMTSAEPSGFAGAAVSGRRWVIRSQSKDARTKGRVVRAWASERPNRWTELPALGGDESGCAIAPLGSHDAVAVTTGQSGLAWATAENNGWSGHGVLDPRARVARQPRLSLRRGGGAWLAWTDPGSVHIVAFDGTAWGAPDSITCAHPGGGTWEPGTCDVSPGDAPPSIAWGDHGRGRTKRDCLCVAIPDSTTWHSGEEVPGSDGASLPAVMQDSFGETWVAWVRDRGADAWVVHTRLTATVESLTVTLPASGRPCLAWRLSEAAPGSVWSVWRTIGDGEEQEAGRLHAGDVREFSWCDFRAKAADERVRYRLRREAVDARDRWWSELAESP